MIADFDQDEIERLTSFLRVGADYETARQAVGWDPAQASLFKKAHPEIIETAQAQFRVLCLNSIMAEGGATGARYLLERVGHRTPAPSADPAPIDGDPTPGGGLEW